MPGQITNLKVLVASPDDVQAERTLVREVIDEINQMLAGFETRLDFVGWEDASPAFGVDPQSVVNAQLGDDYDIFVGILWTRFGTPTPRAGSGTEEEFDKAYARWQENPDDVEIMVFLSTIPADPTQIDTAQLEKVNAFRERVSQRGGFYHRFPSREDFARALRVALMRRALEFGQRRQQGSLSGERSAPTAPPRGPTEEDEVGLLELFELGNQNFNWVTEATERMNQALTDLGERMTQRVEQMNRTSDTNLKRRYVDAAGEDLLNYANRTEAELAIFVSSYQSGIDAYMRGSRMLPLLGSAGVDTMRQSLGSLQSMKTSMVGAVGSMKQLRGSLDALAPLTTPLAKAKRRALGVIDNLLGEWDNAARLSEELIALLSELIARYPSADTSLS